MSFVETSLRTGETREDKSEFKTQGERLQVERAIAMIKWSLFAHCWVLWVSNHAWWFAVSMVSAGLMYTLWPTWGSSDGSR